MIERFIPIVTCLLFTAHVALGCCAHHAHASRHATLHASCAGEHDHASPSSKHESTESDDHSPPADECRHHSCQSVKADVVQLDLAASPSALFLATAALKESAANALAAAASVELPHCRRSDGPAIFVWHCALIL